jgi:hypothetical protein
MISYRVHYSQLQPVQPAGGVPTNNPNDASFNWTFLDSAVAQAAAAGLPCAIRFLMQGNNAPSWIKALAQQYIDTTGDNLSIWWDTVYQGYVIALIQAAGTRYASNPTVKVFALNIASETSGDWAVPHVASGPSFTDAANWQLASGFTCPAYSSSVNVTPLPNQTVYPGWYVFINTFGWFLVTGITGPTNNPSSVTLFNPGTSGNASSGVVGVGKVMQVSDIGTLIGPIYGYTTARFVTALNAVTAAAHTAFPTQVYSHEVGRNGTLDPNLGSAPSYQYNASTQIAQYGYANIPTGKFAIAKNTLSGQNPVVSVALSQTDGSDLYLPAQTVAGSTNTSGTTGTIPAGGRFNAQFLWQCYDPTGQYLPSTTGPNGKPFYANAGVPYVNPVPVFQYVVSLARNYGVQVLETYEQDVINVLPFHGGYSSVNSYSRQPYDEQFQLLGMFCGLF